jgi:hypothetical protein
MGNSIKNGDSVAKGIEILKWAIQNKKELQEACKHFGVCESYLRIVKGTRAYKDDKTKAKEFDTLRASATGRHPNQEPIRPEIKNSKKSTVNSDGTASYEYDGSKEISSLEEAIKFFKIDTNLWEIDRFVCNSYPVSAKYRDQDLTWDNGVMDGKAIRKNEWITKVNYQVKVFVKKKVEIHRSILFEDFYKDLLKKHAPNKYKHVKYSVEKEKNLLEINICDLHLGKLCWGGEVGNNYDIKIASRRFNQALHDLIERAGKDNFSRILFVVGNDFFNSDNHINTTTEGTRQDEDSRWQKTYTKGVELLVEGIDYSRQFAEVDVMVIPGNHDWTKSFYLGETLAAWYRNDTHVKVDNRATPRKYYLYGNTLLGFTHGDKEHNGALRMLMPIEAPKEWAKSQYREFHCGHWHRELSYSEVVKAKRSVGTSMVKAPLSDEQLAVVIRHLRSLAGTDAWHHGKGYQGPIKGASAFLWSYKLGLLGFFNSNIRK